MKAKCWWRGETDARDRYRGHPAHPECVELLHEAAALAESKRETRRAA